MANISFYWHPLFKYVMNVKTDYYILLKDELNDEKITYNEYEALMTDYDFKNWIEYLNNNANKNDIGYLKVFEPLLINQYGNLVLFKYRNYIDLSSMGYGESDFFSLYNGLYLECRSIVIDVKNDEIVLASMSKFKNYGEDDGEWSQKNILNKIKEKSRLKEDENGRLYVDLSGYNIPTKNPVLVLTRGDKSSLYPLRDLAYNIFKIKKNDKNNLIVLGEDQIVYMQQIAATLDIMGYKAPSLTSYSFVLLDGAKMATRDGTLVLLEDFIKVTNEKLEEAFNGIVSEFKRIADCYDNNSQKESELSSLLHSVENENGLEAAQQTLSMLIGLKSSNEKELLEQLSPSDIERYKR